MKLSSKPRENLSERENYEANELGFQVVATILSPLSLYGGNQKTKLPLLRESKIHALKGNFENSHHNTIRWMSVDCTLLSLDANLRIPTCVLHFEVSRRAQILSQSAEPSVLALGLNQGT
jgi:hypothetical protein